MLIPEGWAAFPRTNGKRFMLHKIPDKPDTTQTLKTACNRVPASHAIAGRREVPDISGVCEPCSRLEENPDRIPRP